MIKNATFVSVWDDDVEIESSCKVNTETKEVFDIEMVDVDDFDIDTCTGEYIILDGVEYDVYCVDYCCINDIDDNEYWYN